MPHYHTFSLHEHSEKLLCQVVITPFCRLKKQQQKTEAQRNLGTCQLMMTQ